MVEGDAEVGSSGDADVASGDADVASGDGEVTDGSDDGATNGDAGEGGTGPDERGPDYADAAGLDAEDEERLQGFIEQHGFLSWLGISVESVEPGRVVFSVPYDEKLANPAPGSKGTLHGGVTATLVDTISGFALRSTFENPAEARLTTTDLNVSYLRPARDDLTATAEVVRAGGSMGVTRVTVESTAPDGEEKAVAVGRTSYRLFRGDDG